MARCWMVRGNINDGRDGFPNNQGELSWYDWVSGRDFRIPVSYEDAILKFCHARAVRVNTIEYVDFWSDLNGSRYRKYIVKVASYLNDKRTSDFAERELLVRC